MAQALPGTTPRADARQVQNLRQTRPRKTMPFLHHIRPQPQHANQDDFSPER